MFDIIVVYPLTNFVLGFYLLFGSNLGLAIIFFTIFLRTVLLPLTIKQIQQQKKMAELQPKIQELQSKRKESTQMSPEEMALMKQTATSCIGGCAPIVIQIPVLIGLNMVIGQIASVNSDSSKGGDFFNNHLYFEFLKHAHDYVFNTNFLGFDLSKIPQHIGLSWDIWPYAILIVLLVITQFIQSKIMNSVMQKRTDLQKKKTKANAKKLTKEEKEKEEMQEAMNKWMQMQTTYFLPLMIGIGAYSFTAALGIYWLTQNLFAIGQTFIQYRHADGKLNWKDTKEDLLNLKVKFLPKKKEN